MAVMRWCSSLFLQPGDDDDDSDDDDDDDGDDGDDDILRTGSTSFYDG